MGPASGEKPSFAKASIAFLDLLHATAYGTPRAKSENPLSIVIPADAPAAQDLTTAAGLFAAVKEFEEECGSTYGKDDPNPFRKALCKKLLALTDPSSIPRPLETLLSEISRLLAQVEIASGKASVKEEYVWQEDFLNMQAKKLLAAKLKAIEKLVPDYYTVLGVAREATPEQIAQKYKSLGGASASAEVTLAYKVLSDTSKRDQYTHGLTQQGHAYGVASANKVWNSSSPEGLWDEVCYYQQEYVDREAAGKVLDEKSKEFLKAIGQYANPDNKETVAGEHYQALLALQNTRETNPTADRRFDCRDFLEPGLKQRLMRFKRTSLTALLESKAVLMSDKDRLSCLQWLEVVVAESQETVNVLLTKLRQSDVGGIWASVGAHPIPNSSKMHTHPNEVSALQAAEKIFLGKVKKLEALLVSTAGRAPGLDRKKLYTELREAYIKVVQPALQALNLEKEGESAYTPCFQLVHQAIFARPLGPPLTTISAAEPIGGVAVPIVSKLPSAPAPAPAPIPPTPLEVQSEMVRLIFQGVTDRPSPETGIDALLAKARKRLGEAYKKAEKTRTASVDDPSLSDLKKAAKKYAFLHYMACRHNPDHEESEEAKRFMSIDSAVAARINETRGGHTDADKTSHAIARAVYSGGFHEGEEQAKAQKRREDTKEKVISSQVRFDLSTHENKPCIEVRGREAIKELKVYLEKNHKDAFKVNDKGEWEISPPLTMEAVLKEMRNEMREKKEIVNYPSKPEIIQWQQKCAALPRPASVAPSSHPSPP